MSLDSRPPNYFPLFIIQIYHSLVLLARIVSRFRLFFKQNPRMLFNSQKEGLDKKTNLELTIDTPSKDNVKIVMQEHLKVKQIEKVQIQWSRRRELNP